MAEEKLILDTPLVDEVVPLPLVRVTGGLWVAEEGGVTPLQSVSLWMGDTPLLLMINIKYLLRLNEQLTCAGCRCCPR